MNKAVTVSVALAAYNGQQYLPAQLNSLFLQTRVPNEIVICDDSPDKSTNQAISEMIADAPCPVKYFYNGIQLGVNANFSKAVSLCIGDIIFLCDQDDIWLPEKIEYMLEALSDDNAIGAIFCNSTVVDHRLNSLGYTLWEMCNFGYRKQKKSQDGNILDIFLKRTVATGHNIAFKAKYKPLLLPFPPCLTYDIGICILLACVTKWKFLSKELTLYRIHDNNISEPGMHSFNKQLKAALLQGKNDHFKQEYNFFQEILSRLEQDNYNISSQIKHKLKRRIDHASRRANLSGNIFCRIPTIIRETINGNYFTYANGIKSILSDIFLKSFNNN